MSNGAMVYWDVGQRVGRRWRGGFVRVCVTELLGECVCVCVCAFPSGPLTSMKGGDEHYVVLVL